MTIEPLILWILGTGVSVLSAGVVAYVALVQRITKLEAMVHEDLEGRVIKMEALFELLGEKAAKLLHSPDDHHGIDELLDKYMDRNYELSFDEWQKLLSICGTIENNKELSKGERVLAAFLGMVSSHKLRLPPPEKRKIE